MSSEIYEQLFKLKFAIFVFCESWMIGYLFQNRMLFNSLKSLLNKEISILMLVNFILVKYFSFISLIFILFLSSYLLLPCSFACCHGNNLPRECVKKKLSANFVSLPGCSFVESDEFFWFCCFDFSQPLMFFAQRRTL